MTRARAALLLVWCALIAFAGFASSAHAEVVAPLAAPKHGRAILFVVEDVSFEELLSVPSFRALAADGGAALMTTNAGSGDRAGSSYRTLGAGAPATSGPSGYLMARVLRQNGVGLCLPPDRSGATPNFTFLLPEGPNGCSNPDAVIFGEEPNPSDVAGGSRIGRQHALELAVERLRTLVTSYRSGRMLIVVLSPFPSGAMDLRGDELTPLVVAEGSSQSLMRGSAPVHALRSDTTRKTGLVSNVDVAPTILHFFGIPIPSEMDGSPIETTDAPAPFALHRLHLEQRRIRLPLQLGEVAFVSGLAIVGIGALLGLAVRGSLPRGFGLSMAFAALCGVAFGVALLAGGLLPRMTYAWAVPFLVITTVGLAALSLVARDRGPLGPFTFLGAVTLGFVVLDGVLGGQAFRTPLLGGTMFDGVRFYGLPNAFIALPLAGALFLAAELDSFRGSLLLVGVGLFCGFPALGANIGASITLFAAAGMWWVVRTRPRIRLREVTFVAGVVALGLGVVLLANRLAPGTPTHAGRFVARTESSWHTALTDLRHRLGVGLEQIRHVPAAVIPLVGLIVVLILALRPVGPIREGLSRVDERWPYMIAVLCASSMVAYLANDTGVAAAAPGFLYAITALAYPAYLLPQNGEGRGVDGVRATGGSAVNSRRHVDGSTRDGFG